MTRILFVCTANACRSQMAEAIGRRLAEGLDIDFESAGTSPGRSIDPGAKEFLARRGFDLSGQKAKGLMDVGSLSQYTYVIALCDSACVHLPRKALGSRYLEWPQPDPTASSQWSREDAYGALFACLEAKIGELIVKLQKS